MEYNGYKIEGDGTFGMKVIKPLGKGSVPMELRGRFTNTFFAMQAIDSYMEKKDGKAKQSS